MIVALLLVIAGVLTYAVVKHVGLAKAEADIKNAVANADKAIASTVSSSGIVAGIKVDLKKYLDI